MSRKVDQLPDKLKKPDEAPTSPPSEPEDPDSDAANVLDSAKAQIRSKWDALEVMTLRLHQRLFMGSGGTNTSYVRPRSVVQAVTDFRRNAMVDSSALETFQSAQRLQNELLDNANAATFATYSQFLGTIEHLKGRVQSWSQGLF